MKLPIKGIETPYNKHQVIYGVTAGAWGKKFLMPYPINQSWREKIELNWIGARVRLWDMALKFLSPGLRNDVTDHLAAKGLAEYVLGFVIEFLFHGRGRRVEQCRLQFCEDRLETLLYQDMHRASLLLRSSTL